MDHDSDNRFVRFEFFIRIFDESIKQNIVSQVDGMSLHLF